MKQMFINGRISRETEKAVCFTTRVQWGSGSEKVKDVWFPKSTVLDITDKGMLVKYNMAYSISCRNMFHGYTMEFPYSLTIEDRR